MTASREQSDARLARVKRGEGIQKKVMQRARWSWIRAVRHDKTLTLAQRTVAAEILDSYNDDFGYGWVSLEYISDNLNLSRRAVATAVSVLEAKGYIKTLEKGGGRGRSSRRTPVWSKGINRPKSRSKTVKPCSQNARADCPENCAIDSINSATGNTKTVKPAAPDSSYKYSLQDSSVAPAARKRFRKARDLSYSGPSRESGGAGSDANARQGKQAFGERQQQVGSALPLPDTIEPPIVEGMRKAAQRALLASVESDWGVLGKIDFQQLEAAWHEAVLAELNKPGTGRAVLIRTLSGADGIDHAGGWPRRKFER